MAYHHDLLEQARHLAMRERRRPKQASLRRAMSAAYYALFHFLVNESSALMVGRAPSTAESRHLAGRAFSHSDMYRAAKSFSGGTLPEPLSRLVPKVSPELKEIGKTFVELQEHRHLADYDLNTSFMRQSVLATIDQVAEAMSAWHRVRETEEARLFLLWMLLGPRIVRR